MLIFPVSEEGQTPSMEGPWISLSSAMYIHITVKNNGHWSTKSLQTWPEGIANVVNQQLGQITVLLLSFLNFFGVSPILHMKFLLAAIF